MKYLVLISAVFLFSCSNKEKPPSGPFDITQWTPVKGKKSVSSSSFFKNEYILKDSTGYFLWMRLVNKRPNNSTLKWSYLLSLRYSNCKTGKITTKSDFWYSNEHKLLEEDVVNQIEDEEYNSYEDSLVKQICKMFED